MKGDKIKYLAENMDNLSRVDRLFLNNPVVMQGLGLAPLVVAATSMKNAAILAVAVMLLLMPTRVIAAFLSRFAYFRFRGFTYSVTAAVLYIGVLYIINMMYPSADVLSVGMYLPLLVVEPIIIKRYERPQKERVSTAFKKGILTSLGFIIVLVLIGFLREFLGSGSLYGVQLLKDAPLPFLRLTSGGFIILGIVIAIWRACVNAYKKYINMGAKRYAGSN